MTGAPTVIVELLAECEARDIRLALASDSEIHIDAPEDALTPHMMARLKAHKADLLALLLLTVGAASIDLTDVRSVWHAALDRLSDNSFFSPDLMHATRAADVRWADDSATETHPQAAARIPMPEPPDDPQPVADPFLRGFSSNPRKKLPTTQGLPPGYLDPTRPRQCRLDMPQSPPWCKNSVEQT